MIDDARDARAQAVLDFWFGSPGDPGYGSARKAWFVKDDAFDARIRSRFLALHEAAATRRLEGWRASAPDCLALVVVLDQFSRNMFRGTPEAFACDSYALELAEHAVGARLDAVVPPVHRMFFYLPFEHSESLLDQERSVALFAALRREMQHEAFDSAHDYAVKHRVVIERFGRFPHRNAILGRESTSEEIEFLAQPGSSF